MLLPPFDRYSPRAVIALGDSFHDGGGPFRVAADDRTSLADLQRGRDWIWVTGNHDPEPAEGIGGTFVRTLAIGPLAFRHEPTGADGEIAGHLHPVARVRARGRSVSRRCFASDGTRMVMPAFGAYAGGLNVRHRAFADVFGTLAFTAHMLGEARIYALAAERCIPD
jgi:DNA ligase-associated metallophosphoesterase